MRRTSDALAVFLCIACCGGARAQLGITPMQPKDKPQVMGPPISWLDDYDEAAAQAKKAGRPLFVFYNGGLKGARLLEAAGINNPEIQLRAQRFVCVQFDPKRQPPLAEKLGIKVDMGVLFADAEGTVLARLEGNPYPEHIVRAMDEVCKAFGPIPSDADLQALDDMLAKARAHADAGRIAEAVRLLTRMVRTKARCASVIEAKATLDKIDAAGAALLKEAEELLKAGKSEPAAAKLRSLVQTYEGTDTGARARDLLARGGAGGTGSPGAAKPDLPAAELDAMLKRLWYAVQAARLRDRVDDETDALEKIAGVASGEDKARAEARLAQIAADPELRDRRAAQLQERDARVLLARAKMWLRTDRAKGEGVLKELIEKYPATVCAEEARELLESAGK